MDALTEIVDEIASQTPIPRRIVRSRQQLGAKNSAMPEPMLPLAPIVDEIARDGMSPMSGTRSRQQRGATQRSGPMPLAPLAPIVDEIAIPQQDTTLSARSRQQRGANSRATSMRSMPLAPIVDEIASDSAEPTMSLRSRQQRGATGLAESIETPPLAPIADKPKRARQVPDDTHYGCASVGDDGSHAGPETHQLDVPVIAEIVQLWRMRQRWHRAEKSLILQGKAICRIWTKGDKEKASELFDASRAAAMPSAKPSSTSPPPDLIMALAPFNAAIDEFAPMRAVVEKKLRKAAKSLPIWSWAANVRGFGDLNLAAIVGEAGDIGSYKSVSALWKRMGLAVIYGVRQRKMSDKELAIAHGYSPTRRSVAFNLGECLIKGNADGKYRQLYLSRKDIEAVKPEVKSKAHAHNRAARYMTKAVLRDLYVEWARFRNLPEVFSK